MFDALTRETYEPLPPTSPRPFHLASPNSPACTKPHRVGGDGDGELVKGRQGNTKGLGVPMTTDNDQPSSLTTITINMRERWTPERALAYVQGRERPAGGFTLTWLIEQLPAGVVVELPRVTTVWVDLNAEHGCTSCHACETSHCRVCAPCGKPEPLPRHTSCSSCPNCNCVQCGTSREQLKD